MNTSDILKKCIEIPGVSLKKNSNSIELCMEQPQGKGSMTFFSLFPGISVAYIFINSQTWPMPDLSQSNNPSSTPLTLNYCISGRCELFLDNSTFVYLKDGEFSIAQKSVQEQYTYPLRIYEGLEFLIDIFSLTTEVSILTVTPFTSFPNFFQVFSFTTSKPILLNTFKVLPLSISKVSYR